MSRAVYDAWHDAGPVERFQQDRLRATWPTLANALDAMPRAAGGQEKPNCPLTDSGLEHRPHHYLTPVPWDCPGLPAAPVGGQVEPSDAQRMLDAIRRVVPLNAELRHDGSEDPGMAAYVEGVNAAYDAAAAVSGEQS